MDRFVPWTDAECETVRSMAEAGMSTRLITEALNQQGRRVFTQKAILGKAKRLAEEGVIVGRPAQPTVRRPPGPAAKPDSLRSKRKARAAAVKAMPPSERPVIRPFGSKPRKTNTVPARQQSALYNIGATSSYKPAPVIAGFPTVQVRRDIEGNRMAPVTLRRIDFGGARA